MKKIDYLLCSFLLLKCSNSTTIGLFSLSPYQFCTLLHFPTGWFDVVGWICSLSFCQNWAVPSIFLRLLQKRQNFPGDVEQLLRPNTGTFFWTSGIYALWCQLWYLLTGKELQHTNWTSSTYWVPRNWHFRKVHNVVFSWVISMTGIISARNTSCSFVMVSNSCTRLCSKVLHLKIVDTDWWAFLAGFFNGQTKHGVAWCSSV